MKITIFLFGVMFSCLVIAEEVENQQSSAPVDTTSTAIVEETTATIEDPVAARRAEIQARLAANRSSNTEEDPEYNRRMAAMKVQHEKVAQLRIKLQQVEAAIVARKDAVISSNEEAATLATEIAELEVQLKEKSAALEAIVTSDDEYIKLVSLKEEVSKQLSEETEKTTEIVRQNMRARSQPRATATEEVSSETEVE